MIQNLLKLALHPRTYLPVAAKRLQQKCCPLFENTGFYLQGQMDINPRSLWHNPDFITETNGYFPRGDATPREVNSLEAWDVTRRDMLVLFLRKIVEERIDGAFAELGVYRGHTARLIHHYAPERRLYLFDTFEGFTAKGAASEEKVTKKRVSGAQFADTSVELVRQNVRPQNDNVRLIPGYFPGSIPPELHNERFAFVHLDADLYLPTIEGLKFFFPRLARNGLIVVHDYNAWPGVRLAVTEFCHDKVFLPMPDKSGSAVIVRTHDD